MSVPLKDLSNHEAIGLKAATPSNAHTYLHHDFVAISYSRLYIKFQDQQSYVLHAVLTTVGWS